VLSAAPRLRGGHEQAQRDTPRRSHSWAASKEQPHRSRSWPTRVVSPRRSGKAGSSPVAPVSVHAPLPHLTRGTTTERRQNDSLRSRHVGRRHAVTVNRVNVERDASMPPIGVEVEAHERRNRFRDRIRSDLLTGAERLAAVPPLAKPKRTNIDSTWSVLVRAGSGSAAGDVPRPHAGGEERLRDTGAGPRAFPSCLASRSYQRRRLRLRPASCYVRHEQPHRQEDQGDRTADPERAVWIALSHYFGGHGRNDCPQ
jgi:hypothetical protein